MGLADNLTNAEDGSSVAILPEALIKALRPHQWTKNGLVFVPFVFSV